LAKSEVKGFALEQGLSEAMRVPAFETTAIIIDPREVNHVNFKARFN
jgi:hypothetical protein